MPWTGKNRPPQNGLLRLLWDAQRGLCFLCSVEMRPVKAVPREPYGWSRDHVYARAGAGRGLHNNIVLAHGDCNQRKGDRDPTPSEIERTRALYTSIGLVAFVKAGQRATMTKAALAALSEIVMPPSPAPADHAADQDTVPEDLRSVGNPAPAGSAATDATE